ncbi:N-acetylglucosaminyltransferase [Pseudomaricurvus sp. HS19]|uniref:N-acetylglucosaminyltransferase n=1 Tax=Pseudomaricurvus sp. HS19 TaxID=2692626 RepID=UPI00136B8ABB|nr:N-acetylglucosaminyltransferase [Pseudomaricurvus sp. HS19]MYM63279.1 N-acetylglucosaminyltransferase [Pseudomaricurvus sp. HS19]
MVVRSLLAQGEAALEADKLLQPEANNAFDRFQAVLLLQPDNQQAQSGLKQISARYAQLARDALAHSKLTIAREYARSAELVDPDSPLLPELQVAIARAAAQQARATKELEFPLALTALNQRDAEQLPVLAELVARVRESHESLLIVARNDAEGRWVYQQLRNYAEGYRIRGDIKVGPQPHIVVLPPID